MCCLGWNPLAAWRPWTRVGVSGGEDHPQCGADPGGCASAGPQCHAAQLWGCSYLPACGSCKGTLLLWQQVCCLEKVKNVNTYVIMFCPQVFGEGPLHLRNLWLPHSCSLQFPSCPPGADLCWHHREEGHQAFPDHEWDCLWKDNGACWKEPGESSLIQVT